MPLPITRVSAPPESGTLTTRWFALSAHEEGSRAWSTREHPPMGRRLLPPAMKTFPYASGEDTPDGLLRQVDVAAIPVCPRHAVVFPARTRERAGLAVADVHCQKGRSPAMVTSVPLARSRLTAFCESAWREWK